MRKPARLKGESEAAYIKRACKLLRNEGGHSLSEIAKKMNIDRTEVFNNLHNDIHYCTQEEIEEIHYMRSLGMSYNQIAEVVGVSKRTVAKKCQMECNLFDKVKTKDIEDKSLNKIIRLYNSGKHTTEIGIKLGMSETKVRYRLQKCGAYKRKCFRVSKEEHDIINKLHKKGWSIARIANYCDRSKSTIAQHIEK